MAVIKKGDSRKADLLVVRVGDAQVAVKDFAAKGPRTRALGRFQIWRECRAYRWLGDRPGLAKFLGRVDAHALALEKVEGEQLAFAESRFREGEVLVARLRTLIDDLHASGVFHQDLRGRENVLLRSDGELVLLDFASALCLRPGGIAWRCLRPVLRLSDESAFLKWKALLTPGRFTAEEQRFLRRFRFFRSLWPFNRKPQKRRGDGR